MSPDVDFDPTSLDGWGEIETCGQVVAVTIGSATYQLHCENDAEHEPPCSATLLWTGDQTTTGGQP